MIQCRQLDIKNTLVLEKVLLLGLFSHGRTELSIELNSSSRRIWSGYDWSSLGF